MFRLPLFAFILLLATGCNVYEGLYEPGASDDPVILMQDADAALQSGDVDKAVDHLEKALKNDPENTAVRVKLSGALLEQADLKVTTLVSIADELNAEVSGMQNAGKSAVCSFPERHAATAFNPREVENFEQIVANAHVLDRVMELMDYRVKDLDVIAEDLRHLEGYDFDVDNSRLIYSDEWLIMAFAYAARSYLSIVEAGGDSFTFYHVTSGDGSTYMGYCAPDQATLEGVKSQIACELQYNFRIVPLALYNRAVELGSEQAMTLFEKARDAYFRLYDELDATCTSSSVQQGDGLLSAIR